MENRLEDSVSINSPRNERFGGKVKIILTIIVTLVLSLVPITSLSQEDNTDQKPLSYNISVNVKLLPVFALDKNGWPVFDLAKDEIELLVNGKPYEITYFKRFDFETSTIQTQKIVPEVKERVVFIILDTMFNSNKGYRYSKKIARDIIKEGKSGDRFVVFENNPIGGLKHIGGPDTPRKILLSKIARLKRPLERWASQLYKQRSLTNNIDFSLITDARLETIGWESLRDLELHSENMRYKYQVKHFSRVLSDFQYILKTISKPKLVFLISEGMADGAFKKKMKGGSTNVEGKTDESDAELLALRFQSVLMSNDTAVFDENKIYSTILFDYLQKLVKSINYGGSVINTINPRRLNDVNDSGDSGEKSLKYLAHESGGTYYSGTDSGEIVKRIKKNTSAYYEMVFHTKPDNGEKLKINVRCKRKGVRLLTTNYAEGSRYYRDMDPVQKKMFAFNVATGGDWSRHSGKVMRIPYKKTKSEDIKRIYTIDIPLPNQMKNRKLDIFLIQRDRKTNRVDMRLINKDAKDWVKLNINGNKKREQFFVIIEPLETYCIYNKT